MKLLNVIFVIVLFFIMVGCKVGSKQPKETFTVIDVNANYSKKELVLQDFMEVEYVALETTSEFITKGIVKAIGKNIILATNAGSDGDILVFDRATGKGLRKINHRGQGGEEYALMTEIALDEDNNEMFVVDYPVRKVLVYDLYGKFKRSFKFADDSYYSNIYNYDKQHLICFKGYLPAIENERSCHIIISKQNGDVVKELQLPCKEVKTPVVIEGELTVAPAFGLINPIFEGWVLSRTSSDTIYRCLPNGSVEPFIVRTPSVCFMIPEVFLFVDIVTNRYCFMHTLKKEVDFKTFKGFPETNLVYDMQENSVFRCEVYNGDLLKKSIVELNSNPISQEIAICQTLDAASLVETNEEGLLKGELKKITDNLDEESNPVLMLVKPKI